jgi:hypothetical protein
VILDPAVLKHRLIIWAAGILALGVVWASYSQQARIANFVAIVTATQTEALGPDWGKVRTSAHLAALVPALREQLERAAKAGTKPVAAVHVSSGEVPFNLPDWSPCGSTAPPGLTPAGGPEAAGAAPPPSSPQLLVSAEAQGALTGLADGSLTQTWAMFANVRSMGGEPTREQLCGQDIEHPCTGGLTVDPKVEKAWKDALAPPSYRIDVFVGASLGLDGAGITGGVMGGRGRVGWFAAVDYVLADPARSRVSGGARLTLKR